MNDQLKNFTAKELAEALKAKRLETRVVKTQMKMNKNLAKAESIRGSCEILVKKLSDEISYARQKLSILQPDFDFNSWVDLQVQTLLTQSAK